ncbi:glycerophosphocholine phosphodiesterase GPCPD1 [Arctopsyche grandis]|uniref:glycerophosphocholine phosphodiesterase GPCPD1 n=1 Tax=Arctopsyche grandis TaxID=121162 RepID=UPI00406D93F2
MSAQQPTSRRKRARDADGDADEGSAAVVPLRTWRFSVRAPPLLAGESVCVSGECAQLGAWAAAGVLPLTESDHDHDHDHDHDRDSDAEKGVWSGACQVPARADTRFRYCVCALGRDASGAVVHAAVRSWETEIRARVVPAGCAAPPIAPDEFGRISSRTRVDRGWLTADTLLQFKFCGRSPFAFKSPAHAKGIRVKVIPVDFQFGCDNTSAPAEDSNADGEDTSTESGTPSCTFTQVATLNAARCRLEPQEQFGRAYVDGDFLMFNVTSPDPHALAYLVDFYRGTSDKPPRHFGYSYVLPNLLKRSEGQIELPITCSTKHRPLGSMNLEYMLVYPMKTQTCDMRVSYSSYWNDTWKGLDVGHRGLGSSFKNKEGPAIRENTIASLKTAAASGADLLEFDVQLSKDLVPVVYHDFHVCIALKRKKRMDHSEMLEIPMKDLTLEQLHELKVYHVVEGRSNEPRFFDEDLDEHQPFPELSEVLQAIDPHVGFNIEVKWTMLREDGSLELQHPIDLNLYVDTILDVVLRSAGSRRIIFSCFHPDVCTMLRLKQNIYPVMFLTQGVTTRYPGYHDPRCTTIPAAVSHALNAGLLGIVVHTEDLLRDSTQVKLVTDAGLIIFCWGDDNNNTETIKYLKQLGLHGVIYDKLDQFSNKEVKESIFMLEARQAQKDIMRIASNEDNCGNESDSKNEKTANDTSHPSSNTDSGETSSE